MQCTIVSKINVTPKGVYLPISKLHSILPVANLLAHNSISQICYCGQISLQSAAVNYSFSYNIIPLGVTFNLLAMVPILYVFKNKSFLLFFVFIFIFFILKFSNKFSSIISSVYIEFRFFVCYEILIILIFLKQRYGRTLLLHFKHITL